ncbi:MAG: hypothetical protein IPI67_33270 [Myxococcales bacterium]|nr:hypothetical protein [Myxococcales bacterium]
MVPGKGMDLPCSWTESCLVYDVPKQDAHAAQNYGICLGFDYCQFAKQYLPGGVRCYDEKGNIE